MEFNLLTKQVRMLTILWKISSVNFSSIKIRNIMLPKQKYIQTQSKL